MISNLEQSRANANRGRGEAADHAWCRLLPVALVVPMVSRLLAPATVQLKEKQ